MKCKDSEAVCPMRDKSSAEEQELVYQARIIARPDPIDWFNFRCIAAKDILVALVAKSGSETVPHINLVVGAIGMADYSSNNLKEKSNMAPDMLLGLDAARGADRTTLQIMDMKTGKLVAMSDNVEFHCSPIWTEKELRSITETLKNFNTSWTAEVKLTHKQMRQFKRQCKESGYKKPRIPRKLKKWITTVAFIHAEYLADLFYSAFSD